MKVQIILACGLLTIFLQGCSASNAQHVTVLQNAKVWKGSCVVLPCKYTTGTVNTFVWFHNAVYQGNEFQGNIVYHSTNKDQVDELFANRVQYAGKETKDCAIKITNFQKEDEGRYQVRLYGTGFKWMSKNVTIEVSDTGPALEITNPTEIRESNSITLTCSINYYCPMDNIIWIGEVNGTSTPNVKYDLDGTRTSSSFTFSASWKDDKKNITCVIERGDGETGNKTIQLNVKHSPKNVQVLPNNATIKIQKSQPLTLTCSVESSNPPAYQITWYKDESLQNFNRGNEKEYQVTSSGTYLCKAKNTIDETTSKPVEVSVLHAPRFPRVVLVLDGKTFDEEDVTLIEGDKVTFQCIVNSSNPDVSKYTFYKNNEEFKKYINRPIEAKDAGQYICEAQNTAGRTKSPGVYVDVHYPPNGVKIYTTSNIVQENQKIKLTCSSKSSKPKISRYEWYKNRVLFRNSTSEFFELWVEWTHTGSYSCKAFNVIGFTESQETKIIVQYAPRNVTLNILPGEHVTEHMDVKMTCTGKGNPDVGYTFYLNDVPLSSGYGFFSLYNVQVKDSGKYSCVAQNDVGPGISNVVYLHVSYSPTSIGKFASMAVFPFIALLIIIFLIVRFRVCIRGAFSRKKEDDTNDSSFFIMKKSNNESADNMGRQAQSMHGSIDQLNYASVKFPPAPAKRQINPPSAMEDNDITTVYSVVRKVPNTAEYENIESSKRTNDESQDEIHYSVITNLKKKSANREYDPEVEYAKLRHS
ncbi:B-cell receptor CD22-like isoform X2 [Pyxicephalus adspersus]|uniref:B-cell receptor CD22-like isoform X2 n=1 Tax=Pyxicephalus adspersus TaxID=30357 RepID=UPI003B5C8D62